MGHGAKILMPYIHALKDVDIRLYLIDSKKFFAKISNNFCCISFSILNILKTKGKTC